MAGLAALAESHAAAGDVEPPTMREALCALDALMRNALTPAAMHYAGLLEQAIRAHVPAALGTLGSGSLAWPAEIDDPILSAAVQARALDEHLLWAGRPGRGPPADVDRDYRCDPVGVHLIPRPRAVAPSVADARQQPYSRRGLVHHRVVPVQADGLDVTLRWFPDLAAGGLDPGGTALGAAFFQGMTLIAEKGSPGFIAADAPCDDEQRDLDYHCREAFTANCLAVAWPELSMPPARLAALKRTLVDEAERHEPGVGPSLIVPGSWHEPVGDGVRNVTRILSRIGRERILVAKTLPLDTAKVREAIEPAFTIQILVNEDILVAFAICRDFCEARLTKAFRLLPVDLVIVPSFGNARTILGHRDQAKAILLAHDTRTFAVQHADPAGEAGSGVGYVLPPVREPDRLTPPGMLVPGPFSLHPVEFKDC